jgi:hypothetical protein
VDCEPRVSNSETWFTHIYTPGSANDHTKYQTPATRITRHHSPTMLYQPGKTPHNLPFDLFKACPIGWISTTSPVPPSTPSNPHRRPYHNLAPYSQFAPMTFDPLYILFPANQNPLPGTRKDTVANVEATGKFAWNLATYQCGRRSTSRRSSCRAGRISLSTPGWRRSLRACCRGTGRTPCRW